MYFKITNGYLYIVKFLVRNGADIHADDDYALKCSALDNHFKIAKFLVKNGANIHAQNDYALIIE